MVVVGTDKIMVFDELMVLKASTIWWFLTSWRIRRDVFKCWCFMMSWCLLTSWCFFDGIRGVDGSDEVMFFFDESEIWTSWRFKQVDVFWRGDFFDDSDEVIVWTSSWFKWVDGFNEVMVFDELMFLSSWCFLTRWWFFMSGLDELMGWRADGFDDIMFWRVDSFDVYMVVSGWWLLTWYWFWRVDDLDEVMFFGMRWWFWRVIMTSDWVDVSDWAFCHLWFWRADAPSQVDGVLTSFQFWWVDGRVLSSWQFWRIDGFFIELTVLIVSSEVELAVLRRKWRIVLRNNEYVEEVA